MAHRRLSRPASTHRAVHEQLALASATPPRHFDPNRDGYWDGYRYEIDAAFADLGQRIASHRRGVI